MEEERREMRSGRDLLEVSRAGERERGFRVGFMMLIDG